MERDKRRSKEEEEELDRKIALIREKNQKIEQRTKEIEADRVNNTDQAPKKSPKTPSASSQPAKGGKNREWDHGKTPADTWRENVPSMDLNNRLAGRGGDGTRGGQRGRGGGQRQRNAPEQGKGGRLEGRVTLSHESADGHRGGAVRGGGRNRGGRGGGRTYEREVQNKGGELQISIKNIEPIERGGERRRDSRNSAEKKEKGGDKQGNRPQNVSMCSSKDQNKKKRHESDNYVVRSIVGKLVDRVDRMGKAEKRREARETEKEGDRETEKEGDRETEKEGDKEIEKEGARETEKEGATPEPEIRTETPKEEKKSEPTEAVPENAPEAVPGQKTEEENTTEKAENPESTEKKDTTEKEESTEKEASTQDANQNVITLAKEKVLSVEIST